MYIIKYGHNRTEKLVKRPRRNDRVTLTSRPDDVQQLKQTQSWVCIDCGINTAPGIPPTQLIMEALARGETVDWEVNTKSELYQLHNKVWADAGMKPWGGCLCVGCIEQRLGRKLRPKDFKDDPYSHLPGTKRLRDRRGGAA